VTARPRVGRASVPATLALAVSCLFAGSARATTIDPLLWQQLVEDAAFVGVVECDQAGGIVARYRVVETWKGAAKPGDAVAIKTAVNIWGPRYPLALVGDRRVVTAYAGKAPSRMMSTTMGPRTPPTWMRAVPHDFTLPLFQGAVDERARAFDAVGSARKSVDAFKKDVVAFVARNEEDRALEILRALGAKYSVKVPAKGSHRDVVKALLDGVKGKDAPGKGETARQQVRAVERLIEQAAPLTQRVAHEIAPPVDHRDDPAPDPEMNVVNTPEELERARASVRAGMDDAFFSQAVSMLLESDPAPVVDWAVTWVDPKTERDADAGYYLGSWVAAKMNASAKERPQLLERMAKQARDPWMRAAGAVYLAYDDEARAAPLLRTLSNDKGDVGTWAALALARRGDRAALVRAVDALAAPNTRVGLRARVIELLSNTAASVKKPTPVHEGDDGDGHKKALAFLKDNPSAVPVDPWLSVLKAQRRLMKHFAFLPSLALAVTGCVLPTSTTDVVIRGETISPATTHFAIVQRTFDQLLTNDVVEDVAVVLLGDLACEDIPPDCAPAVTGAHVSLDIVLNESLFGETQRGDYDIPSEGSFDALLADGTSVFAQEGNINLLAIDDARLVATYDVTVIGDERVTGDVVAAACPAFTTNRQACEE
jgi:hypothetical protein